MGKPCIDSQSDTAIVINNTLWTLDLYSLILQSSSKLFSLYAPIFTFVHWSNASHFAFYYSNNFHAPMIFILILLSMIDDEKIHERWKYLLPKRASGICVQHRRNALLFRHIRAFMYYLQIAEQTWIGYTLAMMFYFSKRTLPRNITICRHAGDMKGSMIYLMSFPLRRFWAYLRKRILRTSPNFY